MKKIIVLCVSVIQIMILLGLITICITLFWSAEKKDSLPQPKIILDPITMSYRLSYDHLNTGMTPEDEKAAFEKWREKAEKGDMIAQNNVGEHYMFGKGVEKDEKEGVKWCRLSAERGYFLAQYNLSTCLMYGKGTTKNVEEAIKWLKLSAEQGFVLAQLSLGGCYGTGTGVPHSDDQAFKWYKKAADQGNSFGEYQVAMYYENGWVVQKNAQEAKRWYKRSAEHGNPMGQHAYSKYCYWNGEVDKMIVWQKKAAEQGYAPAQYNLGISYAQGIGLPEDMEKATELMNKAAVQGDEDAKEWLERMKNGEW